MKCVCGYEQGMAWVGEDPSEEKYIEVNPHGNEFIRIKGNFTIDEEYGSVTEVGMYACPECGTVKMKKY